MQSARNILRGPAGNALAGLVVILGGIGLYLTFFRNAGPTAGDLSADRVFIDADNGKQFNAHLSVGDEVPVKSPFSGKMTGYEATPCYWTADGKVRPTPSWVLLKQMTGGRGPTFCPDCHRLVVPHNPMAEAGHAPPPTEAEYAAGGDPAADR